MITWVVDHSKIACGPKNETAKKYAEAERLLKQVIARHPKTPWADLAQDASIAAYPSNSTNGIITRSTTNALSSSPSTELN